MSRRQQLVDSIKLKALDALPKNVVSRAFGAISEVALPSPIQGVVNQGFASLYNLNTAEAERSPAEYRTLNAFFTRHLKDGARPIEIEDQDQGALVSPVDGRITQFGPIEDETLIQAKGKQYGLVELLDNAAMAEHFKQGAYATIYLSPRDYHRIHSPASGRIDRVSYVPGQLWPVNPLSVRHVDRLFAINERLITYVETSELGKVAVIKVGATCVGRIGLAFNPLESNTAFRRRQEIELVNPVILEAGEEMAVFNLGSTVILLVENPDFAFSDEIVDGQMLQLGQKIGGLVQS
ncbi:MAG: archaetidylserine decarboxylase [Myxococcota bacterium]|nr:archaetidylserine decarboxylase [Myxococcota bacterium]